MMVHAGVSRIALIAAGLIAALGCDTGFPDDDDPPWDDDAGDDDSGDVDADGDGYPASVDCDDGDAALNWDDADLDGWSTCEGDCDDFDSDANPADADEDGISSCDGDCDDGDPASYPGAPELCDGADNDCDGTVDEGTGTDNDGDGFSVCDGDCDDANAQVYPGAPMLCDGVTDNDCDGQLDANEADADGDSYTPCSGDCDDGQAAVHPGAPAACDGIADNDCDGQPDANEVDGDGDGTTPCGGDCDDGDAAIHPGATELCDGLDNDCSGSPEVDGDGVCGIWSLAGGEVLWDARALDPGGSPNAPQAPIEAAFPLDELDQIWVLTATTYHAWDPVYGWVDSGFRSTHFPEVDGLPLRAAAAVPSWYLGLDHVTVFFYAANTHYYYWYDLQGGAFTLNQSHPITDMGSPATQPTFQLVDAAWMDLYNASGWVTEGDPLAMCGPPCTAAVERYLGMLVAGSVYLFDTCCDEFFHDQPAASWSIFAYPGAPGPSIAAAAAWYEGELYVFGP